MNAIRIVIPVWERRNMVFISRWFPIGCPATSEAIEWHMTDMGIRYIVDGRNYFYDRAWNTWEDNGYLILCDEEGHPVM